MIFRLTSAILLILWMFSPLSAQQDVDSGLYGVVRSQSPNGLLGEPVSGALVNALDSDGEVVARSVTSINGAYRLVVSPGSYRLAASHPGYKDFDTGSAILFVQRGHFTLFNIGLEPRERGIGGVKGIVLSAQGQPLAAALVTILDDSDAVKSRMATDEGGAFSFELPPGAYKIAARHPEHGRSKQLEVVLEEGEFFDITIALEPPEEPKGGFQGLIRARASGGSAGRPIPGAVVIAENEDGSIKRSATTNNIGFYKLALPAGVYRISVSHLDFEPTDSGGDPLSCGDELRTWNALLQPKAPLTSAPTCRDQFPVSVGHSYGEKHSVYLRVRQPGVITVAYRWSGDAGSIALIVLGPDRVPRRVDGSSPLRLTVQVSPDAIALGSQWELCVRNFSGGRADGTLTVTYPCEK